MIAIYSKIPIRIHPVFFLVALLIGWISTHSLPLTLLWGVIITISILVHELGHALAALSYKHEVAVELVGFGGLTRHHGPPLSTSRECVIVAAGPLFGLALFATAAFLFSYVNQKSLLAYALAVTAYINLFWSIFNLLPIHPLDGGKLASLILERWFGLRGLKMAFYLSVTLAGLFSLLAFAIGEWIIGAIFALFAFESGRFIYDLKEIHPDDRNRELQEEFKQARELFEQGDLQEAKAALAEILEKSSEGIIATSATETLGRIHALEGNDTEALQMLEPIKEKISPPSRRLLLELLFQERRWEEAKELALKLYKVEPDAGIAERLCSIYAELKEWESVKNWLTVVEKAGGDLPALLARPEFEGYRS